MSKRNLEQYLPLIRSQAHKFSNLSALNLIYSYEDLVSEGIVRYLTLDEKYAELEDEVAFASYLKMDLYCEFVNRYNACFSIQKGIKTSKTSICYDEHPECEDMAGMISMADLRSCSWDSWDTIEKWCDLPGEAKEVVSILYNTPPEMLEIAQRISEPLLAIKTFLNKHRGWGWAEIEEFWRSIPTQHAHHA